MISLDLSIIHENRCMNVLKETLSLEMERGRLVLS